MLFSLITATRRRSNLAFTRMSRLVRTVFFADAHPGSPVLFNCNYISAKNNTLTNRRRPIMSHAHRVLSRARLQKATNRLSLIMAVVAYHPKQPDLEPCLSKCSYGIQCGPQA